MSVESIEVRAERVSPVATDMAGTSKVFAALLVFVSVIVVFAMMSMPAEKASDSAEQSGQYVGMMIVLLVPAYFAFKHARNASRATRSGNLAKTDPSYTWRLSGKYIIAADRSGAPRPELSFKINGKLRTMLLAVPRAEVVDRS